MPFRLATDEDLKVADHGRPETASGIVGQVVPLRFTALDDKEVKIEDLLGRPTFVIFFANFSPPSITALDRKRAGGNCHPALGAASASSASVWIKGAKSRPGWSRDTILPGRSLATARAGGASSFVIWGSMLCPRCGCSMPTENYVRSMPRGRRGPGAAVDAQALARSSHPHQSSGPSCRG